MKKNVLFIVAVLVVCLSVNAQITTQKSNARKVAVDRHSLPQAELKKVEKAETKTLNAKFGLNSPVKQVLSTKKLKGGSDFRIVRLENGMIKKQLINPAKQLQRKISANKKLNRNIHPTAAATAAAESLFEGFEGWNEEAWDWLPDGWSDESKAGSLSDFVDVYGDKYNFTWRTTWANAKSGMYSAGVQFSTGLPISILSDKDENGDGVLLDTIPYIAPSPQDEWLYSPSVTVKQTDYVFAFDLFYDPFWARLNYDDYTFDAMHTVVEALISTDGGSTWMKKWDSREYAAGFTEDELWIVYETGVSWLKVSINLQEYLNKDVKIAVRYWDDGGESVYVDNVTVGYLMPEASYRRPEGYLISGLSENYYSLNANIIIGNAFTPTQWHGNVENADAIHWDFSGYTSSTEKNPTVTFPYGLYGSYETPVLTATSKGGVKEFQLGVEGEYNLMSLGGDNRWDIGDPEPTVFGLGNYDMNNGYARYVDLNEEDMADYGTFRGVANYFEKPANKFMFETFYVHAANVVTKPDEPVRMDIYAVDENYMVGELIATSEAYPEDFVLAIDEPGFKAYTIPFKFKTIDPETGREVESYVEIDDHFVAEFYNYKTAEPFFERENPTGDKYAYATFEEFYMSLNPASAWFDMDATFPFLYPLNDEPHTGRYAAPTEGGTKEFDVISYWLAENGGWWLKEDLPDWITIANPVSLGQGVYTLPVTAAPLPQDVKGRKADVTIQSFGCEMTLEIKQGEAWFTGIASVDPSKKIKVSNQGGRFVLSYPEGTASVAVFSVTGQKVAEYTLNPNGTTSIPAAHLAKGVYILKFAGKTSETVKIIK